MKKKILICDDDKALLEILTFLLRKEDVEILTLPDGSGLLSTAKKHSPALILLDLMMPEKDGIGALRALSGDPASAAIPVIVLSSTVKPELLSQAKVLGAREFIEKPFNPAGLLEMVRKYTGRETPESGRTGDL